MHVFKVLVAIGTAEKSYSAAYGADRELFGAMFFSVGSGSH
jgi:hypothetical protein